MNSKRTNPGDFRIRLQICQQCEVLQKQVLSTATSFGTFVKWLQMQLSKAVFEHIK